MKHLQRICSKGAPARRSLLALLASVALGAGLLPAPAEAQNFPNKPIHIVVPFPPGGSTDLMARRIGEKVAASLKQPVVFNPSCVIVPSPLRIAAYTPPPYPYARIFTRKRGSSGTSSSAMRPRNMSFSRTTGMAVPNPFAWREVSRESRSKATARYAITAEQIRLPG